MHPELYHFFRIPLLRWLFCRYFPMLFRFKFPTDEHYLRCLAGDAFCHVNDKPAAWQFAQAMRGGLAEFDFVRAGYQNDVTTWIREDVFHAGNVTCPTLILHDPTDPQAPMCHARHAADLIPGAELVELNTGGHLIWYGPDAKRMQQLRTEFLRKHLAAAELAPAN
jgi:pimeloyl-ACP methyl ester carboxylesterase